MHTCMHTYVHTYTHTYTHNTHTYIHHITSHHINPHHITSDTYMHTLHTYITHMHTYITHTPIPTPTHTLTHPHPYTPTPTHTNAQASQNHTPWCTVKERYECCIRQGAHGAEEQPCPGLRTNLQYRRNGARNTGSIRFVLLKMEHKATESVTATLG